MLDPNVLFDEDIDNPEPAATSLAVDNMQRIYEDIHTTKLHRVARHLGGDLRSHGILWEGDTSVNCACIAPVNAFTGAAASAALASL